MTKIGKIEYYPKGTIDMDEVFSMARRWKKFPSTGELVQQNNDLSIENEILRNKLFMIEQLLKENINVKKIDILNVIDNYTGFMEV